MEDIKTFNNGIPISVSLATAIAADKTKSTKVIDKKRLLFVSTIAVLIAAAMSLIARLLIMLIDLITHLSFFGSLAYTPISPAENKLGLFVIAIPVFGGIIIGFLALYGSKAIRGHGIPEAMEQILTNKSKIKPAITFLKPVSSAISIGTGGPFGAEGPIIATGGALGSTLGQLLSVTHHERKILLAAGATAGMSAIFNSPVAAIFLAIELLLFEFSPRSIIPVALACITGAAGHYFLFEPGPVFPMYTVIEPSGNNAIFVYSLIGITIGLLSILVTKSVYLIEDGFSKLPVHWMWWPAIGGLAVGLIGYYFPRTLGVGYNNITDLLAGKMAIKMVAALCFFKFVSWAIALGSGTSGGTLAPLLTIGGAVGAMLGSAAMAWFPTFGISIQVAALAGMSAMFAGASRALLTSIIFALETTGQANAFLPVLATCMASYVVSFFLMENTIMTEKIARRGVFTPDSYEADPLQKIVVEEVFESASIFSEDNSVSEVLAWIYEEPQRMNSYYFVTDAEGQYKGMLPFASLVNLPDQQITLKSLIDHTDAIISSHANLRTAVEVLAKTKTGALAVVSYENANNIIGILTNEHIITVYASHLNDHQKNEPAISLKRTGLKILLKGKKILPVKKFSKS